jgi:hypothetical protein
MSPHTYALLPQIRSTAVADNSKSSEENPNYVLGLLIAGVYVCVCMCVCVCVCNALDVHVGGTAMRGEKMFQKIL